MRELRDASPRFIIEIEVQDKGFSSETDATISFPELRKFLDRFYVVVVKGNGYLIRERSEDGQPSSLHPISPAGDKMHH
jgi:hypothetical protein